MAAAPELIPEAAGALESLALLGALAAVLVVLGLVYVIDGFVRALFGGISKLTGHIPLIGGLTKDVVISTEQSITNALGKAEARLDSYVATTWHKLARVVDKLGHELFQLALLGWTLAKILGGFATYADYQRFWKQIKAQLATLEHAASTALHNFIPTWLPGVKALERWVHAQIRHLVHAAEHAIPYDIRTLRARTKRLEGDVARDWKLLRKHERLLSAGALTAVVAAVLSKLGISWARCNNVGKLGRNVCGMDASLLEALLADSLLIVGSLSLVEFAREMVGVTDTAVRPITTFWRAN